MPGERENPPPEQRAAPRDLRTPKCLPLFALKQIRTEPGVQSHAPAPGLFYQRAETRYGARAFAT